jgi:hypothetical protein
VPVGLKINKEADIAIPFDKTSRSKKRKILGIRRTDAIIILISYCLSNSFRPSTKSGNAQNSHIIINISTIQITAK